MSAIDSKPVYLLALQSYISLQSVSNVCSRLEERSITPILIRSEEELEQVLSLKKRATLLVPGGSACGIGFSLGLSTAEKIKAAVESGWNYFGICAGAVLGSENLIINIDGVPANFKELGLKFFNLLPVETRSYPYPRESGKNNECEALITTSAEMGMEGSFKVKWNEGPSFKGEDPSWRVIASYYDVEGRPPAIVMGECGEGKVVLSGVHIESTVDDPESEKNNKKLFEKFLNFLDVI